MSNLDDKLRALVESEHASEGGHYYDPSVTTSLHLVRAAARIGAEERERAIIEVIEDVASKWGSKWGSDGVMRLYDADYIIRHIRSRGAL